MATHKNGLLGGFRGKLGNIVGTSWNGIPVVRSAPGPRRTPPTALQLQQQEKFKILVQFFRPLTGLLNQTFKKSAKKMTCFNKAISENRSVIVGEYPEYRINYEQVALCNYMASAGEAPSVSCTVPGILKFSWDNRAGIPDLLFVAAYCGELNRWIYKLFPQKENDGSCHLDLAPFSGYGVQSYIGFRPLFGSPTCCFSGPVNIL